ncbi:hypothetical protein R3P38DRAFT_3271365 [Favolaschia claudopus]|uniref:Uncharacterized protein n=1 Tax=Favolaschia claudopus TaxID=2862362 RepID=A0AAW0B835_9AGAR
MPRSDVSSTSAAHILRTTSHVPCLPPPPPHRQDQPRRRRRRCRHVPPLSPLSLSSPSPSPSFNVTVNDSRTLAAPLPSTRLHHPTGHIHLFPARRRGFFSRKCPATRAEIYWSKTEVGEKIKTATPLLFASPLSLSKLYEQVSERRSKGVFCLSIVRTLTRK